MPEDEEEKKKREEEARAIISNVGISNSINSINYANMKGINLSARNENEQNFINKVNEANSIINSINPRKNVPAPSATEEELEQGHKNIQGLLDLMDNNIDTIEQPAEVPTIENIDINTNNENKATQSQREAVNVIINKNKHSALMTNKEKEEQEAKIQQNIQNAYEANSDKNILSQIGKNIENLWLGAIGGAKELVRYITNPNHTKQQETELTVGLENNRNIPNIVSASYKAQNKQKESQLLINVQEQKTPLVKLYLDKENEKNINDNTILKGEKAENLENTLDEYRDVRGDLELNPIERNLSESIANDQSKISSNINQISNPILKKTAELLPSTGNSLVGAGISMVNPYLGMSYFVISASGSYETDGRNRGMTKEEARDYGTIMGFMEGATEMIGVSNFLKAGSSLRKGAIKEALKRYGLDMADNAIQEAIIDPVDELAAGVTSGKTKNDYSTREGWEQLGKNMIQDGIDGALSALLMNGIGASVDSSIGLYNKIRNNSNNITEQDLINAYTDIQNDPNINVEEEFKNSFEYQKEKYLKNTENVYTIVNTDEQGNISLTEAIGENIAFDNKNINIKPVIVYDNELGYYNVIDGDSGTKLDTTPYSSKQEAIDGFNEKINKIDNATINNINNAVAKTKIALVNKANEIDSNSQNVANEFYIKTSDNQVYSTQDLRNINENMQREYTRKQYDDITKTINQISDEAVYNSVAANRVFDTVSNNIENVKVVEQSGNRYINSLNEEGRVVYQQKISNRPYTGKAIKNIVNTAIENADTTSLYQEANTNNTQTSSEPNASNFYNNQGNNYTNDTGYAVQNIEKVITSFDSQESYSRDELADVWNNQVSNSNYDAYYNSDGNIERYIAVEEEGKNIVVNQYDSNDNVVKSEVIPSENGRYKASDIRDTISRVASLYDENRPIKGQQDIEGNEVLSMKKKTTSTKNKIKYSKQLYNSDNSLKTFKEQLDINQRLNTPILVSENSLEIIGNDNPILVPKRVITKAQNTHNISKEELYDLPEKIKDYVLITKSQNENDSNSILVFIDQFDKDNNPIMVAIKTNAELLNSPINEITSIYGRKRENIENFLSNKLKNKILKINDKKIKNWLNSVGIQFPKDFSNSLYNNIVPQGNTNVNNSSKNNNRAKPSNASNSSIQNKKTNTAKVINSLNDIKAKYKNQIDQLNIFENKDNTISINNLVVKQNLRNKGIGQNILNDIIDYADKNNKTITLTPTSKYLTKNKLTTWYKNNGFVENKGKNTDFSISDTMYRLPKNNQNVKDDGVRAMKKNTSRSNTNTTQTNTAVDNQGRTLSRQQQEYFKDSKVRDENGNLLTVYHTTTNVGEQFNIFDPRNTDFYRFGDQIVNYYTNSKAMSGSYADGSYEMAETSKNITNSKKVKRQYEGYINIVNPYVIDAKASNWNNIKTEINDYGKKLLNEIDVLEKNNIYDKLKQIYDDVERTSQEASNKFFEIQKKAGFEQYHILGEYARFGNIDNIYENGLFNEQGKIAISQHLNDKINGKTLKEIGLNLYNNKYETLLNKEIDKLKKQYPDIRDFPLEDIDIIAEHFNEGKNYIENRYKNQETTNDIVKKVIDMNNKGTNYDGIIIENVRDYGGGEVENYNPANVYVTFSSNQFKNADNTTPTSNQDIRFAKKSAKTPKVEGEILEPGQTNAQRSSNYIEQEIRKVEESGNWDNSIPVTKMTDIRKTIEDYLGIGVQKGHFRQQAYGIYKGNRDVIRTKELKDMDTILHETGHALDIGKRIKLDKESISNELLTAVKKYGGYEAETRDVQLEEGFAEVIREYTIVPNQARIDYPQTVAILEGIRQTDKNFNNFITTLQQQTYNYIHQNPRNRTLSNVSIGERTDKPKWSREYIQQEVMRNVYDRDIAIKYAVNEMQKINGKKVSDLKASENAYYLTRLASGVGDKVVSMLSRGYIDENGNKLMPGLEDLGEILGNNEQRFNDLRAYLVASRDLEYKAKTLKTGIRTMDSRAVVEQFKNDTQIQEAAKLVYDTLDGVMQYAVNNGLITQEIADSLRESNAFYVPMQRVLEGNKNNVGRRGSVREVIKARTGSELDVKDVLENIVVNSANIIQQVENNNILKALYNQGEQSGMTGKIYDIIDAPMIKIGTAKLSTWENELKNQGVDITKIDLEKTIDLFAPNNKIDANNLITSFIDNNGKRVYLQFNDEILFNSLMNMDKKFMSRILNFNRKINMPLRYGATMANIGFAIPNMVSDTAQAAIFSEAGFIPVLDNLIGVMDVVSAQNKTAREFFNKVMPGYADRINTMYALYEQTGATSATRMSQYREQTQNLMKDVYGTKNSEVLGIKERFKPLKRFLDIMTYIPEISEQSTRFRVFEKNLEYYRRNGMAETDARIQAALQSRDATQDFGRTGNVTREINQLIPFSAARVGSAYTFAEKVKANPKRVASRLALLMTLSTIIKAIGYDDDEIEELNQRKKNDNFVLKIGDQIITIKKPQGILRSIVNFGEYIQDLFTGNIEEGKEGERLAELIESAIMDNMPADSVTGLVPNMVAPVVENAINKDLYYNSDIVKSYDLELPDSEQYYDYNSQLAIWLGQIFNYSPAKIDNLISGYFAGLGTSVTNVIDWIAGKTGATAEEPEMGAEDNAVGKRFFVNVNSNSQSVDDVYTLQTELKKKENGGTITSEEKEQLEALKQATSDMSSLNKQIKEIKKSLTMSGEEKAEQIKELQKQKTDVARKALGKDLLYSENAEAVENVKFYPSRDTLTKSKRTLTLTPEMKKEYEQVAAEYYQKYEKQGIYSKEKLEDIESKAKDYAKNYMMKKYKSELVKNDE